MSYHLIHTKMVIIIDIRNNIRNKSKDIIIGLTQKLWL